MKVLMINKFLFPKGGAETYTIKVGTCLQDHGHEVQYFGMNSPNRTVGNALNEYTGEMDFHEGSMLSKALYPIKTVYSTEARTRIRRVLEHFQPDVCHLNNFNYQLTPSIIVEIDKWRRESGHKCRIIYTAHDPQLVCPNHMLHNPNTHVNCEKCLGGQYGNCIKGKCIHGSLFKSVVGAMEGSFWRRRDAYQKIDAIICCSRFLKTKLDTNPVYAPKTIAIHNFVENVPWEKTEKEDYVLYFGRYSMEKGIEILVSACKALPEIPFVFAGSGPMESAVEGIANIKNVGFQTGKGLEQVIRKARFSVCPSVVYENCPFSVLESQMYGTPVLGARIGGIPELIQEGKTGEFFEAGNWQSLRAQIEKLWENPQRTAEYAANCEGIHFDDLEDYYRKLMLVYEGKTDIEGLRAQIGA